MTTHDDDDFEDEDVQHTPSDSHVGSSGGEALADLLLRSIASVTTMAVLLAESDEDEWRAVWPRYATFLGLVEQLPRKPRPRRRVGFRVPKTKAKATKKRGKR